MKQIELTKNKIAIIDDSDYNKISKYKWFACEAKNGKFYAAAIIDKKCILLHVFLLSKKEGFEIDHKDGNGLNCSRDNLRYATHSQNLQNQGVRKDNTTGYKGVGFSRNKYIARIKVNGKRINLGTFLTPSSAAIAYDSAALKYYGEFAVTNFIHK